MSSRRTSNDPEWGALEQLRFSATLKDMFAEHLEISVNHQGGSGRPVVPIASAQVSSNRSLANPAVSRSLCRCLLARAHFAMHQLALSPH